MSASEDLAEAKAAVEFEKLELNRAKRIKIEKETELKCIEIAEKRGELVLAHEVEVRVSEYVVSVSDMLRNLSSDMAHTLDLDANTEAKVRSLIAKKTERLADTIARIKNPPEIVEEEDGE